MVIAAHARLGPEPAASGVAKERAAPRRIVGGMVALYLMYAYGIYGIAAVVVACVLWMVACGSRA